MEPHRQPPPMAREPGAEPVAAASAALQVLRDNIHLAGTVDGDGTWYYPPTVLDENGRLWGDHGEHLKRVLENRMIVRHYYRSLQPDAPAPALLGRAGHVAAAEAFAATLLTYYRPLLTLDDALYTELGSHVAVLLTEANALHNIALAMRPGP